MPKIRRCPWATTPLGIAYHDHEWGVSVHDDRRLFEFLVLEGAQAGLSWETILNKREAYRLAFEGFDPGVVAAFDRRRIQQLMGNAGIIRNRLKIEGAVRNAAGVLRIKESHGSFDRFIWRYVDYRPIQNRRQTLSQVPASTEESNLMSKDLKKMGFNFVGPTICYAFMQAVGMVNDHTVDCFRHGEIQDLVKQSLTDGFGERSKR